MKKWLIFTFVAISVCILFFDSFALTSHAIRETSGNAKMLIRRYERKGHYGKAALWQETAARSFDEISIPLARTMMDYYTRNDQLESAKKMEDTISSFMSMRDEHLRIAKLDWEKARESKKELDAERVKTEKFMSEWVPYHPNRFYEFDGSYPKVFKKPINTLKKQGKYSDALFMEADSSDMRALQYEVVTIKYFLEEAKEEEKAGNRNVAQDLLRQAEVFQALQSKCLKRSALLRTLAKELPTSWPKEADEKDFDTPPLRHKLTANEVIKLVRMDKRIQQILDKKHEKLREDAYFQGPCWTVSYYARGHNLGIAFVDDDAAMVIDVLISPQSR